MPRPEVFPSDVIYRQVAGRACPAPTFYKNYGKEASAHEEYPKKTRIIDDSSLLWFAFFVAFEPNNYFGLKASASSSQPVARVRAYQQEPGTNLILGDSRLAHFDMALVDGLSGRNWQNLAFGGASLKETLDLADYVLDSGRDVDTLLVEVSFYTLNAGYNTDRFATLEEDAEQSAGLLLQPRVQRQCADRGHGHTARHARYD